jgi:hypothetical protein
MMVSMSVVIPFPSGDVLQLINTSGTPATLNDVAMGTFGLPFGPCAYMTIVQLD